MPHKDNIHKPVVRDPALKKHKPKKESTVLTQTYISKKRSKKSLRNAKFLARALGVEDMMDDDTSNRQKKLQERLEKMRADTNLRVQIAAPTRPVDLVQGDGTTLGRAERPFY